MKSLFISLLIILFTLGCQETSSKDKISLMEGYRDGVNPNSISYVSANNQKNRENKIEISKINSNTKIEIAKIKSSNDLLIAKVNADAKKDVAKTDSTTKIQTSQIDAVTKKDDIQNTFYITIALVIILVFAMLLLFLNNKKNRELKNKLHQDQLHHEQILKEKEYNEKRLHKMLDLVEKGKLSQEMEQEVIHSLTKPQENLIPLK